MITLGPELLHLLADFDIKAHIMTNFNRKIRIFIICKFFHCII